MFFKIKCTVLKVIKDQKGNKVIITDMKCHECHVTGDYLRGLETQWLGQEVGMGRRHTSQENYHTAPRSGLLRGPSCRRPVTGEAGKEKACPGEFSLSTPHN